jgi:hypothetical protein
VREVAPARKPAFIKGATFIMGEMAGRHAGPDGGKVTEINFQSDF